MTKSTQPEVMKFDLIYINKVLRVTDKAALVEIDGMPEKEWVPLSVFRGDSEVKMQRGAQLFQAYVHDWFVTKLVEKGYDP